MYSDGSMFFVAVLAAMAGTLIVYGLFYFFKLKYSYYFLIGFGIALMLLCFTFQKINKDSILTGETPGRIASTKTITRKWRDIYYGKNSGSRIRPMLCFQSEKEVCIEVGDSVWQGKKAGDTFTVYSAPGDDEYYHSTGIYLSKGNSDFDYGLLIFEAIAGIFCLTKMLFPGLLAVGKIGGLSRSNNIKIFDDERDKFDRA